MDNQDFFNDIETLLDSTIEGIVLIENGFIVNVNQMLLHILDYDHKNELIGLLATGCLQPSSNEKFIEYNKTVFQEITILSKNGESIPAIIQIKDITLNQRQLKMVSIMDLTELKQKEMLLLKQSRMAAMGEMLSMIAHQWRQPLASIGAITSSIKLKLAKKKLEPSHLENKTTEINNHLKYMSETIDDFRGFFKEDKQKHYFYLHELLQHSIDMVLPSLKIQNINIEIENKQLSKIFLFENELLQVFLNIFNNAKDAFLDNDIKDALIQVFLEEDEKTQTIYIQDNAGGIPANIIERIFEPYFSTKENQNGTGLGLYMSKTIVEKHCNGTISVKNKNEGCEFKIVVQK